MSFNRFAIVIGVSAMLGSSIAVAAVPELEQIVVTAQKREQSVQDVPISISAVSAAGLERNKVDSIFSLQAVVPGLQVQAVDPPGQGTAFALRGLGNSVFNMGFDPAVATFVDGIYRSRSGLVASTDFLDLDRVEVLKGPQGTLFGKNTTAGVVHLISKKPDFNAVSGLVEVGGEEYSRFRVKAAINLPASDTLAFRLAANVAHGDGWLKVVGGGDNINNLNRWAVKAQMLFEPSKNFSMHVIADFAKVNERTNLPLRIVNDPRSAAANGALATAAGSSIIDPANLSGLTTESNIPPQYRAEDKGVAVELNWAPAEGLKLTSLSGYRHYNDSMSKDNDFSGVDMLRSQQDLPKVTLASEELRLAGKVDLGTGRALNWMFGGFYSDEKIELENDFIWGSQIGNLQFFGPIIVPGIAFQHHFQQDIKSKAAFGQLTYDFTDQLSLTTGVRWSDDKKDGSMVSAYPVTNNFGLPNSLPLAVVHDYDTEYKSAAPTYTASLQYKPMEDVMTYFTYAHGYKSGGISMTRDAAGEALFFGSPVAGCPTGSVSVGGPLCSAPASDPRFDKETADHFELGLKSDLADGRVRLNVALFNTHFKGLQLQTLRADGSFAVSNVAGARSQGVELETLWAATSELTVNASVQYLDAKFDSGIPALTIAPGFLPLGGERLPFSSEWTGNLGLNYEHHLSGDWRVFASGNAYYRTSYFNFTEPVVDRVQGGYALYTLRAGFGAKNWDIAAACRNCGDKIYTWSNFQIPFDGTLLGHTTQWAHIAEPRVWSVTASYRF